MSLVYLRFNQIIFSILAVMISGKLIEVIYEYSGKSSKNNEKIEGKYA